MIAECRLCGKTTQLLQSHIIPKFVFNFIKKTSATGKLRQAVNVNIRRQDGIKEYLYCKQCEVLFSKLEHYFAAYFFYPYVDGKKDTFIYDQRLKKFIVSLCWRILDRYLDLYSQQNSDLIRYAQSAHAEWKNYLLGKINSTDCESYLLLLSEIADAPRDMPDKMEWYLCRGTDATIASSNSEIFIYCLFPRHIFVTTIHPLHLPGWDGTGIEENGTISTGQKIHYTPFYDFLCSRAKIVSQNPISPREHEKYLKDITKNPEKFWNSESAKFILLELKRKRGMQF